MKAFLTFVLIAAAVFAVYGKALDSPFIFDDTPAIIENPSIQRLWPPVGDAKSPGPLSAPQNTPTAGRPLVNYTLAVNYYVGQLNPRGYHVFNVIVHILSAALLAAIVRRTLELEYFAGRFERTSWYLSLGVALLWALHPLHTETVNYVTQRTELMVGFFYLATLYASLRYWTAAVPRDRKTWLVLATLVCVAGAACKEVIVTAPVVMLLFERTFITGTFRQALARSWPLYVGLASSWLLLLGLNLSGPRAGSAGFSLGVPVLAWWATQAKVLLMYLKLAVWPDPLVIHYEMPYVDSIGDALPWVAPVAVLLIGTLLLLWRRHPVGFVGAWVFIILSPTLVVPIITEVAAERRMYLPLAGLVSTAVVYLYSGVEKIVGPDVAKKPVKGKTGRALLIVGGASLLLSALCGRASAARLIAYSDRVTLWQDAASNRPNDATIQYNLGCELLAIGIRADGMKALERAVQISPGHSKAHGNLGRILLEMGRHQEAIAHLEQALQVWPEYPEAHNTLGTALADLGRHDEAMKHFRLALEYKPDYAQACSNLGEGLQREGRLQEAIEQYEQAIRYDPRCLEAHNNLGNALLQTGDTQRAIEHFNTALTLDPKNPLIHINFGMSLMGAGRLQEAVEHLELGLQGRPDFATGWANLAAAQAGMNRPTEAVAAARKAVELARTQGQTALHQQMEDWLKAYRGGRGRE